MGGLGSGGHAGAGRKPKNSQQEHLTGSKSRRKVPSVAASLPSLDEFDAPNDLTVDERNVWVQLAPGAFKEHTLTKATEYAFSEMCRDIVALARMRLDPDKVGGADFRGMRQQIRAELKSFRIGPVGKPMVDDAPKAVDPFDQFDGGATH